MGAFHDLSDMARDYGLGLKYFLLVGGVLTALMLTLFLWGRVEEQPSPSVAAPAETPAAAPVPSSY
jgi:hypothetical protein